MKFPVRGIAEPLHGFHPVIDQRPNTPKPGTGIATATKRNCLAQITMGDHDCLASRKVRADCGTVGASK